MYKLLIVDDEYQIRNGLATYFPWNEIGFEVVGQAENGIKALEFIRTTPVDIILADIVMPMMNGIELAKELNQRDSKIKLIFLSGYQDFEYAQQAVNLGVKKYIVKSTKFDELARVFSSLKKELDQEFFPEKPLSQNSLSQSGQNYNQKIIASVKKYVTENYQEATLYSAASLIKMNPFYLSRFFKQETGTNFSDFLLAVKMQKATEFLQDVSQSIDDVSKAVGYNSPKNFTRTFKSFYGKSPREFRKENH
ncbi:AraC family two component transcriptional regulator [Hydrogenispora ethanolica]|uniref:AraC family two component transcriptional regulator n=1 Tax=Hydrogenispora ethanolica TaxID=1082276 RepID=A0A4R1RA05_HYDET|nr:response regulator [Hydrogenispora ethanolica]TCL62563.1 AraC family two component transcriptional regulator [Hydrogenispora ethanolica]